MIDVEKLSVLEKLVKEQRALRKRIETAFPKRQIDKNSIACFFGAMTAMGIEKDAKLFVMLYLCSPQDEARLTRLFGILVQVYISKFCVNEK